MLTPKNIKAKTAIEYFKQGYYQKGKWHGIGAVMLGLKGEIKNHQVYENIVQGLSPDGSKRLNKREVHWDKRKAAVDCTFAAPKSVSLCAFIGGDERLIQAHIRVVEKVLEEMEARYAQSRVMLDGKTQEVVKTGNMVIGKYDHIESRELDPHLHSHCLVMNMTQLPNGEWYSHLNDEIFKNQKLLGMMYQHYLAIEVQKLGYEIELLEHGQFDIKGYNQEDLIDFSKRRVQILALAGVDAGSVEREKAWSKTRRNKENVAPEELKARWLDEAAALGIEIVRPGAPKLEDQTVGVDEKIFADAIKYCSERQVAFRAEDIQAFILAESQPLDIASVEPLINSSDELIRIQEQNGIRYTTIAAVERELATINLMKAGQGKVSAIAQREIVEAHLTQTELNAGQQQAVMMTLSTTDQFIAWQGVAGAGKTFALKEVLSLAQKLGYSVKGFAPSAKASTVLGQELAAQTQTLARLLASKLPAEIEPNQIWIVDEAGLLGAKDAYRLLQRATIEQARVILVGDTKQLSAVEAGNPFKSLQQAGIETAYLNESQRQKDSPQLKVAIDLLAQGRVEAGFARLKEIESIQKVTRETKTEEIVKAYLQTPREKRAKTLVLAGTNLERLELARALRKALQAEGCLGSDVTLTQLKSKDLRQVQLGYTSHFAVGDLVMPLRNYKRKGLEKGELYEVIGSFTDTIKLKAPDGRQLDVSLDFKKAVYQREQIEIAVGDRLVWKKNNHKQKQVNGQEVTVVAINGDVVKVIDAQGKAQTLDLKSPHHLDHGIVRTTFSAQGETADCVLVAADSTIGRESFYVASSRARLELRFFTTNENELLQWAVRSRAQENPLELIRNQIKQQQEQLVEGRQSQTTPTAEVYSPPTITYPAPSFVNKRSQPPTHKPFKRTDPKEQQPPSPAITPELTQRPIPQPKIPIHPFWTPTPASVPPRQIDEKHWLELVEGSAIHPALAARNVRSLGMDAIEQEHQVWEYLMYSDKLERRNTGQLSSGILKRYNHIENGGWWASAGIDARDLPLLKPGGKPKLKLWGCFKPDCPRVDADKSLKKGQTEYIKYEHPLKEERQLFLFDVPDALAQRIYDKYRIQPTQAEKQSGFWYVTYKYNLPITLAEGAKKTLSSLSQGEITIGVSGVNGGYYANDSQQNRLTERILHPELKVFATRGREFRFAFDQDTKQSTVWNVRRDMVRTGELLELEGCSVRVVEWEPEKGKGLDDLIVNSGALAYQNAQSNSIPLAPSSQKHYRGEYNRLAKKVRDTLPTLSEEAIDVEIYKLALLKGDIRDGARTIAQSNQARSFKATMPTDEATEKTFSYIEQIEKLISVQSRQLRSQSNEVNYDINTEPFKPEREVTANARDKRNGLVDRKTDGVANKQHQADGENRFTREQPKAIERGSDLSTNQPKPNSERVDERLEQLLAAINQYIERQKAEPIRRSLERVYPNFAQSWLSSRGAKILASADEQQDAAILDSTRTDARIDSQITTLEITRQCLNAITQYIEQQSIEATLIETLPALTQKLNQTTQKRTQTEQLDESLQIQTINVIAEYIQQQSIEAALSKNLPALSRKLNQLIGQEYRQSEQLDEFLQTQAIDAIAQYIQQESIEATIVEKLPSLSEQLNQLTQKSTQAEQLDEALQTQAIKAIAQHIEQQSIESVLVENLPALTRQLKQLTGQEFEQTTQLDKPLQVKAIEAITKYVEQQSIETAIIATLPALTQKLNQLTQKFPQTEHLDETLQTQAIDAITKYVKQQSIESLLVQAAENLTQVWRQLLPSRSSSLMEQLDKRLIIEQQRHQQEEKQVLEQSTINFPPQHPQPNSRSTKESVTYATKGEKNLNLSGVGDLSINQLIPPSDKETRLKTLAETFREMPLEEVAERLSLTRDRHDKHKWRDGEHIISINNQKFYDHTNQKGGYGAIDLVMHIQSQNFKQAVDWLSNGASPLPLKFARWQQSKALPEERKPFTPPIADESKWLGVRQYLTEKRHISAALVDELHHQGKIYADSKQNAVFVRQSINGTPSGASLRGTYKDSQFKGLAAGSRRNGGWFSFTQGFGQLEQIVLVESSIDAMSAAALSKSKSGSTMFITTDGTGAVPIDFLRQHGAAGVQVIAAHDADRAGEEMAWKIASEIPAVTRAVPNQGKDWNEQLLGKDETAPDPKQWKQVAQALGKSEAYVNKVIAVTEGLKTGQSLPEKASTAMQQDFHTYKQLSRELWQWHEATKGLGKSEKYLHKKIATSAIAFHHPTQPTPVPESAIFAMEKDLWQHYSQSADLTRTMKTAGVVAIAAIKDGHSSEKIQKILEHDPELPKIRQRAGQEAAHNHIKNALRNAEYTMQPHQHSKQHQQSREPGLQL